MKRYKKEGNLRGFTLVELLVVVSIIAILSVTSYMALGGQTIKARDAKRKDDLTSIQNALEIYAIENDGKYPSSLMSSVIPKKYLSTIPKDPKGHDYVYATNSGETTYQIATVLEKDGDIANYESYVVGAGEDLKTNNNNKIGYYNNGTLALCNANLKITSGKITNNLGQVGNETESCIPYNPNN